MVAVQAKCSIEDALVIMRQTADDTEVGIEDVAECVLDGSVTFGA